MDFPNIDPVIFELGPFAVRWYSLAYIVGILGGLYYIIFLLRRPALWEGLSPPPPSAQNFQDYLVWAIVAVIAGGRLGYVIFYNPSFYLSNPLEIFAIWKGGMSFHGGVAGVFVSIFLFTRKHNLSLLTFSDCWCAVAPIGLFLGRIANFINGELWGRTTDVPWGMVFPRGGPLPRHPSQLYEAALEGLLLFIILQIAVYYFKAFKKPGMIFGLFLIGYGTARIVSEFFREPDGIIAFGITIGMGLSLPMLVAGAWLVLPYGRNAFRSR